MFTGIVEEVGEVLEIEDSGKFRTIRIQGNAVFDDLRTGSSIAVNGVCLTVLTMTSRTFTAEMSAETLDRTSLGSLNNGTIVNLERPMRADSRFGGHIVHGHVDGVGHIREFVRQDHAWSLVVDYPQTAMRNLSQRASVSTYRISPTRP